VSGFATLVQDEAVLAKLRSMGSSAESPDERLSLEEILASIIPDETNRVRVLLGHGVQEWMVGLIRQKNCLVIDIQDTSHYGATDAEVAKLAKRYDFILVKADSDGQSLAGLDGLIRHFLLPSVDEIVGRRQDNEKSLKGILIDYNVTPYTIRRLRTAQQLLKNLGYFLITIKGTQNAYDHDDKISELARRNNMMIVTHDHDFLDFQQHDLSQLKGVVVFPAANNDNDRGTNPDKLFLLQNAIDDFVHLMLPSIPVWDGTSVFYRPDGLVTVSSPPFRPHAPGGMLPKTATAQYWPSPAFVI
jgi:predicted nuclease of predicted toxin-antitoxin system